MPDKPGLIWIGGYLPRFFARFLGFGVNGAGGVFSIRRNTSASVGVRCGFGFAVMKGV